MGAQPHQGCLAPSSSRPSQGWHPRGPQSPFQVTEQRHPHAPPHTSTLGLPRELGRGAAPSPLPLSSRCHHYYQYYYHFLAGPCCREAEPTSHLPPPRTHHPKPFPSAPAHCQSERRGCAGGTRAPVLSPCQQPSSQPAQRQLHGEGARQPPKCVCEPAQPCPGPERLQEG